MDRVSTQGSASAETAPRTRSPGAATSGLTRPSRVGPGEEKSETSSVTADASWRAMPFTSVQDTRKRVRGSCRAKLPTVIAPNAVPGLPTR
jgi:hypothetical protein